MKINKQLAALTAAFTLAVTMSGCAAASRGESDRTQTEISEGYENELPAEEGPAEEIPAVTQKPVDPVVPKVSKVSYITVTSGNVNIRSGAGANYSVVGTAEKSTLYAYLGEENGWYKTQYKTRRRTYQKNIACLWICRQARTIR